MNDIVIAGIGQTPVGEHWDLTLHTQASRAVRAAIKDAGGIKPQAMYIGNFLASVISHQANLGALLAEHCGLTGIEAFTVEAAGASGAGAFRMGYLAVASGFVETAVVVGVEKFTDMVGSVVESAAAQSLDYDYEAVAGATPASQASLIQALYLHETGAKHADLSGLPLLAHANAVNNPYAAYRKPISQAAYERSEGVTDQLNLFDMAAHLDGAAAVVLTRADRVPAAVTHPLVRVTGSAVAIDTLALHDRPDPLGFQTVRRTVDRACHQAGILPTDVDLFELADPFTIYGLLSLEAAGFARRGEGWKLARSGDLALTGKLPVLTLGGLKGRGDPLGATGVYQIVEAALQLRGEAGANQVRNARRALVQALGGPASTAVAHVLER